MKDLILRNLKIIRKGAPIIYHNLLKSAMIIGIPIYLIVVLSLFILFLYL